MEGFVSELITTQLGVQTGNLQAKQNQMNGKWLRVMIGSWRKSFPPTVHKVFLCILDHTDCEILYSAWYKIEATASNSLFSF